MTIKEIKTLKGFDVIGINLQNSNFKPLEYEIYYVMLNLEKIGLITVCQGYYDYYNDRHILLDFTRKDITYDELLLYYDLIHKAGE